MVVTLPGSIEEKDTLRSKATKAWAIISSLVKLSQEEPQRIPPPKKDINREVFEVVLKELNSYGTERIREDVSL